MAEYIGRDAAIKAAKHAWTKGLEPSQYIEALPAADVAPVVHGAWQVTDRFKACSVCGYAFARLLPDKYCPHCGAKMDGERKDGGDG
nr:MAG TPA: DNA polymerase III PolC [Caudoviricetes sp.]